MDIGKPVRIHNIPDPHRREIRRLDWVERPRKNPFFESEENPIPAPNWPIKKPAEVEKV